MGGMVRMSGITAVTTVEPVFYDKDGIVYPNHKTVKPQVTNAKTVSTETAAEARAAARARKVPPKGK